VGSSKACFTASFRSWECTHTHTHKVDYNIKSAPNDATSHTFASLYMGLEVSIWDVHSCVFLNL